MHVPLLLAMPLIFAAGDPEPGRAIPIGPGPHRAMRALRIGEGPRSYWLFEPDEPRPESAPVVVFLHGWMSANAGIYGAWIAHLVVQGHVVVAPRFQSDMGTTPAEFLPNASAAIRDALHVLADAPGRVRPEPGRFALVGHSAGANLAVQLASLAEDAGLPPPSAVVAMLPGEVLPASGPDLARIPSTTALLVAAAEEDWFIGDDRARRIYLQTTAVPPSNKLYLLLRSDRRADPPLVADHASPTAALPALDTGEGPFRVLQMDAASVDLLDTAVIWPAADLALEAGFGNRPLDRVTDRGARLLTVGHRPDGSPIRPPVIGDNPLLIPRVLPGHGIRLIPWPAFFFDPFARPDRGRAEPSPSLPSPRLVP